MCKLIKFKKEFFDIDVKNRKKEDIRKTTIEREYSTLRFNFSDFTREEKKEFLTISSKKSPTSISGRWIAFFLCNKKNRNIL